MRDWIILKILEKPKISTDEKYLKVNLKDDLALVVENFKLPATASAINIAKATPFDKVPGPISLRIINRIWNMLPIVSTHVTSGVVQYVLAVGK